jgi:hypothetical protein
MKFSYSTSNEVSANLSEIEKLLLVAGETRVVFKTHVSSPFILPIDKNGKECFV